VGRFTRRNNVCVQPTHRHRERPRRATSELVALEGTVKLVLPPLLMMLCIAAIAVANSSIPVTETLIEVSYSKLRPAMYRTTEKSFLRGGCLWDRKKIGERVQDNVADLHHRKKLF
jgi:hypothetical protein